MKDRTLTEMSTFFLAFLACLTVSGMAKASCCDDIKIEITKKTDAYKILCSNGSKLSENCCNEIEDDIKKYEMAYNNLCMCTLSLINTLMVILNYILLFRFIGE